MLIYANVLLLINIVLAIVMGGLIIVSNPKKRTNQTLALFIGSVFLWILANLLTNITYNEETALIFARLTLVGAVLIPYTFYIFTKSFLAERISVPHFLAISILPAILLATTPTELNIVSVDSYGFNTVTGPIYLLLMVEFLVYIGVSLHKLFKKSHKRRTSTVQRVQIQYILFGIAISVGPAVIANGILPILGFNEAVFFGPSLFAFLVVFTSLAIIKHQLLNIRVVVVRTLAYLLSIIVLASAYGLVSFAVINTIIPDTASVTVQRMTYTLLAVILAFTFQPLKRFFDRLTNRYFYQDAYDSQVLLDDLNRTLVSTIEIEKLLSKSAEIIKSHLKTEYVLFGLKEGENNPQRIIGTSEVQFDSFDIDSVRSITPGLGVKSVITDMIEESHPQLHELLRKNDVATLVRLTDTPKKKIEGLGYIVLGNKKSGSPYSVQDIKILEIIADELVIAIQNALRFEEIKNFNVTLQDKVNDATKKLRAANRRLIELDQTKDDFISMASHQLRTPLTSIKGYVSMVMEGDAGKVSKKQAELLDQAFISSQRMVYLIADLLNVSRLRTGKFVIEPKETNLADVIDGEISQLKETAKSRDLELTYEKPKNFPSLMLDETKIRQVIMNFADNAIYYTPSGGHIAVKLEDRGDTIEFTVTDDGIGVPKSEQHRMFSKFYRAGNAKKARPDGTGLGLFMAKKVVVAQGGSIIFHSQEGKGSTFGFSFAKKPLLPENFKGVSKSSTQTTTT